MAKRGANVSIIARSKEKLEEARRLISGHLVRPDQQKVVDCSVDISARDTSVLDSELKSLAASQGPIFMLVNCAGFSIPSKLETLTNDQVTKAILGTNGSFWSCWFKSRREVDFFYSSFFPPKNFLKTGMGVLNVSIVKS